MPFFILGLASEMISVKCTVLKADLFHTDQKTYCVCIFQPTNFTGWGSERVNIIKFNQNRLFSETILSIFSGESTKDPTSVSSENFKKWLIFVPSCVPPIPQVLLWFWGAATGRQVTLPPPLPQSLSWLVSLAVLKRWPLPPARCRNWRLFLVALWNTYG